MDGLWWKALLKWMIWGVHTIFGNVHILVNWYDIVRAASFVYLFSKCDQRVAPSTKVQSRMMYLTLQEVLLKTPDCDLFIQTWLPAKSGQYYLHLCKGNTAALILDATNEYRVNRSL